MSFYYPFKFKAQLPDSCTALVLPHSKTSMVCICTLTVWQKGRCTPVVDCDSKKQYSLMVEKPCHATRLIFLIIYDDSMPQFARDSVWIQCLVTDPDSSLEVHRSITVSFYLPCVLFLILRNLYSLINIFRVSDRVATGSSI